MLVRHRDERRPRSTPSLSAPRRRSQGQSLVEFALVFPFFVILLFAVIEFGFVFNAVLSIEFATRDAALTAAEAGRDVNADCSILKVVQSRVSAPADPAAITQVRIFKSDKNGNPTGPADVYVKTGNGPVACSGLPFRASVTMSYPPSSRCDALAGDTNGACLPGNKTVDTIGVEISYRYDWKTPLANLLPLAGGGYNLTTNNAMRMEPIL